MGYSSSDYEDIITKASEQLNNTISNAIRFHWVDFQIENAISKMQAAFPKSMPQKYKDQFVNYYAGVRWTLFKLSEYVVFDLHGEHPLHSWILDGSTRYRFRNPVTIRVWKGTNYATRHGQTPERFIIKTDQWTETILIPEINYREPV
jgi:hypothetical protein